MDSLFILAIILLVCALSSKVLYRYGIPILIVFITIGMLMGSDGPGGIYFDNSELARNVSNLGLLFIIFSGGFGTNWETAKPIALASGVLATFGVILTAIVTGLFAYFVLGFTFLEGMLLGSIISSTDAASVFSILRSKSLNLKNNLAPMLEMESGSNDPMAYMLTIICLGLIMGNGPNIGVLLLTQILVGALMGMLIGKGAVWLINNINLDIDGLYTILVMGFAMLAFSLADLLMGNGFLSVYIAGIIMGNSKLVHKVSLVRYFDGISWLAQIILFLTLGLLLFPSQLPSVSLIGIATAAFIIFVARPIAVFPILSLFKRSVKEQVLISWVGFRGAASIVFAIYPLAIGLPIAEKIFNIVFFVALVSVIVQGTLFIPLAKKLNLIEEEETVLKIFTDYSGEICEELLEVRVPKDSLIVGQKIMNIEMPKKVLIVMIRRDGKTVTPKGATVIKADDMIILAGDKEVLMEIDARFKTELKLA